MICVKCTAFCDLRIRLATLRKSVRKFWFCKLASTCESVWPGLKTQCLNYHYFSKFRSIKQKIDKLTKSTQLSPSLE